MYAELYGPGAALFFGFIDINSGALLYMQRHHMRGAWVPALLHNVRSEERHTIPEAITLLYKAVFTVVYVKDSAYPVYVLSFRS